MRQKGNIATVLAITIASMTVMTGVVYITSRSLISMRVLVNEQKAQLGTQMMLTLITQAVAANGLLCEQKTLLCKWNPELEKKEFALIDVTEKGAEGVDFTAELCLPIDGSKAIDNCEKSVLTAHTEMKDMKTLMQQGMINSVLSPGDQDSFGIIVTARSKFYGSDGSVKEMQKTAAIRRPRAFLKVESEPGICNASCKAFTGNYTFNPCNRSDGQDPLSADQIEVNVRVMNDGPGYIYDFTLDRKFEPSATFGSNAVPEDQKRKSYSARDLANFKGLAPGKEFIFKDYLPCLTRKIVVNTTVPFGSGGTRVETSSTTSLDKTGDVNYAFKANSIDPDNVLIISTSGATIPATTVTINNINELPPPPPPPPAPAPASGFGGGDGGLGGDGGGGGGGGGGCDGSSDGSSDGGCDGGSG